MRDEKNELRPERIHHTQWIVLLVAQNLRQQARLVERLLEL